LPRRFGLRSQNPFAEIEHLLGRNGPFRTQGDGLTEGVGVQASAAVHAKQRIARRHKNPDLRHQFDETIVTLFGYKPSASFDPALKC
jgi:hypothetical protein